MLSVRNLTKIYKSKRAEPVVALNNVSIDFPETGFVFLLGKSGSGKSTLLNSIGGLDTFDQGEIIIKGKSSKNFSQSDFDSYRNTFIGFIFQEYNILENFTVAKNLALAIELQGKKADKEEVMRLLTQVELQDYAKRKPNQLSGGQKQRVAIARALIKNPEIIMADEPTGALDSNTGRQVMETLKELSKTKLVIVVSHDREFAELYGDRIIELKDGKIISDVTKKEVESQTTQSGIKIIDNNIVYIKKGQQISDSEMKSIASIISKNSAITDTFISFDEKANRKLKEGAKINDEGNKEKFLDTQKEDIKMGTYNPNSLKLIRSHLHFKDSFKMGASSLKNKVFRLIFTILLSIFAFTVFGVVDALSCWNRADSAYQAMRITNQKNIVMLKTKKLDKYSNSKMANDDDIKYLSEKFPEYTFKGVLGGSGYYNSYRINTVKKSGSATQNVSLDSSNNPLKDASLTGFVYYTQEDLTKQGFEIRGNLPASKNEIAISKFMMNVLIKLTAQEEQEDNKITETNIIGKKIYISDFAKDAWDESNPDHWQTIVGIVDDKTDFSKYENMEEQELMNKYYLYQSVFAYSCAKIAYVSSEKYTELKDNPREYSGDYMYIAYSDNYSTSLDKSDYKTLDYLYDEATSNGNNENDAQIYVYSGNDRNWTLRYYNETNYNYWYISSNGNEEWFYAYYYFDGDYSESPYFYSSGYYNSAAEFFAEFPDNNGDKIPDIFIPYSKSVFVQSNKYITYFKGDRSSLVSGDSFTGLGLNEILVDEYYLEQNVSDWQQKIQDGLVVYLSDSYRGNAENASMAFTVVGAYSSSNSYGSDKIIMSETTKQNAMKLYGDYSFILTSLTGADSDKALIEICEKFNDDGIRYTIQNSATTVLDLLEDALVYTAKIFLYIGIGFAVFAAFLLMTFISTSISYKKREIGVLRALGARGSDVFGIFFNEATLIAFINFAISAILTFVGCTIINQTLIAQLGVEIVFLNVSIRQMILILAVSWGSAFIASLLPTTKISRKKPIDAINNR